MAARPSREMLRLFALLLEYPSAGPDVEREARRCGALLRGRSPEAAGLVGEFGTYAAERGTGGLEEDYAAVFDLGSSCPLYAGYHLFGESYKRSAFLVGLQERYRARGFSASGETSDHLPVMLRFLSVCDDEALSRELIDEAILPSLDRMLDKIEGRAPAPGASPPDCAAFCGARTPAGGLQEADPARAPAWECGGSAPPPMAPVVEADDSPEGEPKERSAAQRVYIGVLRALRLALQPGPPGGAGRGTEVAVRVHG